MSSTIAFNSPVKLTASEATRFLAECSRSGASSIDLSQLVEFDSAGLAALVQLAPKATLQHAPEKLRKLAALYGMDRIFS
jgi:ABC-type transporter Mla MlaB component